MPERPEPELGHCARCRRLYVRTTWTVCGKCVDMEASDFARIREVLEAQPHLGVEELADRAQVTAACVLRMLDEGLIASQADDDAAVCGRCGAPAISATKRLCTGCALDLDRQLALELNQAALAKRSRVLKATAHHVHEVLSEKRGQT